MFNNPKKTDTGVVYYEAEGVPGARPLLFVHGVFGSARIWEKLAQSLISNQFKVTAMDLPGHGSSEGGLNKLNMDDFLYAVEDVARISYSKPVIIGCDMGGLLSLMAAQQDICETVIAINPTPVAETGMEALELSELPDVYTMQDIHDEDMLDDSHASTSNENIAALKRFQIIAGPESNRARKQRSEGITIPKEVLVNKHVLFIATENTQSNLFESSFEATKHMSSQYEKELKTLNDASHLDALLGTSVREVAQLISDFIT